MDKEREQFRTLTDAELRALQSAHSPITSGEASHPMNDYAWAIIAEGKRRRMW